MKWIKGFRQDSLASRRSRRVPGSWRGLPPGMVRAAGLCCALALGLALPGWTAAAATPPDGDGGNAPPPGASVPQHPSQRGQEPQVEGPSRAVLAGAQPTISLDEVRAGQRGYGLSVFSGGDPERFDVEVIGVWRNVNPDTSYILARLSGQGLERTGVIAGMSGSPVFLDGRLAGAISFGWPFAKEAVGGITPIATMRRLSTLGPPPSAPTAPPPPVELAALLGGSLPNDLLQRQLARLKPRIGGTPEGALSGIEWSTSGFGELSQSMLRQALGSLTPAGQAAPRPTPLPLQTAAAAAAAAQPSAGEVLAKELPPGSAVSAVLVNGDFQLAATGTVTDHFNDHILAFGHPFLGLGPIRLPMARAEVVTVLSSQYSSFKIANLGDIVGSFEQDRQAGIEGRLGAVAPMVPMRMRLQAADGTAREFNVRVANAPELLPTLAGSALLAGLESASYTAGPQGIDLTVHFHIAKHGDLTVTQSFDGEGAGPNSAGYLLAVAAYLMQNSLERAEIESIDAELRQSAQPRAASLVSAHAERSVVHPGDSVHLNVDLVAYRGERFRRSLNLLLPDDLQAGRYSLLVGDGASADAARLALQPADPVTFPQALELLRNLHSRRNLAVLGLYAGPGLAVAGEVMPRLPASVRSLWGAAPTGSAIPLRTTIAQQRYVLLPEPMEGLVRVDLEVRRRGEPVQALVTPAAPPAQPTPSPAAPAAKAPPGKEPAPPPPPPSPPPPGSPSAGDAGEDGDRSGVFRL
jgi:hypothetical protein